MIDEVPENGGDALPLGKLGDASFVNAVADHFLTNPITRASALMAELSARAKARAETAIAADAAVPAGHPSYGLPPALAAAWDGRLHFASTETASDMGGLMEGALASADRVLGSALDARRRNERAS